jgi:hypothetical protein
MTAFAAMCNSHGQMLALYPYVPPGDLMSDPVPHPAPDPIAALTIERGARYGSPLKHFACTQRMYREWRRKRSVAKPEADERLELALAHVVYLVCDKLARAAGDLRHLDNWDDIQGYAKCAKDSIVEADRDRLGPDQQGSWE